MTTRCPLILPHRRGSEHSGGQKREIIRASGNHIGAGVLGPRGWSGAGRPWLRLSGEPAGCADLGLAHISKPPNSIYQSDAKTHKHI